MKKFKLQPSTYFLFVASSVFSILFFAISLIKVSLLIKLICLFLSTTIAYQLYRCIFLKNKFAVITLQHQAAKTWLIETPAGLFSGVLCNDSIATHLIAVLRFKIASQPRIIVCTIFRDALVDYETLIMLARFSNDPPNAVFFAHQSQQK